MDVLCSIWFSRTIHCRLSPSSGEMAWSPALRRPGVSRDVSWGWNRGAAEFDLHDANRPRIATAAASTAQDFPGRRPNYQLSFGRHSRTAVRGRMSATSSTLIHDAIEAIAAVRDDPEGRFAIRHRFYQQFGFGRPRHAGYGESELAFLRWEIERGVLNPISVPKPGSPWWAAVNETLLLDGEIAARAWDRGVVDEPIGPGAKAWIKYFHDPSPRSWYIAHNTSIVFGYMAHTELARAESQPEQQFMNIVLYRLLYAHAMVEGAHIAWGRLGVFLANPKSPAVNTLMELPDFYPRHYPLTPEDIRHVCHRGHSLADLAADVLDGAFCIPHLDELYRSAAGWLGTPLLEKLHQGRAPCYPIDLSVPDTLPGDEHGQPALSSP